MAFWAFGPNVRATTTTPVAERDLIGQRPALNLCQAARSGKSDGTIVGVEREQLAAPREHREIAPGPAARLRGRRSQGARTGWALNGHLVGAIKQTIDRTG